MFRFEVRSSGFAVPLAPSAGTHGRQTTNPELRTRTLNVNTEHERGPGTWNLDLELGTALFTGSLGINVASRTWMLPYTARSLYTECSWPEW